MMGRRHFLTAALAAASLSLLLYSSPAAAQTAEQLRANAQACELPNGFMRAIDNSVRAAVDRINAERRRVYEQQARSEGVSLEAVGQIYARQLRSQPHYRPC